MGIHLVKHLLGRLIMKNDFVFRINQMPGNVMLCNEHGTILSVNSAFAALTGYQPNPKEVVVLSKIITPEGRETLDDLLLKTTKVGVGEANLCIASLDGSQMSTLWQASAIDVDDLRYILIQVIDKSQFLKSGRKHKEQERFLKSIINSMPGLVYRCLNDDSWTMIYLSDHCFDLTGFNPENLINNKDISYDDLIHPHYQKYVRESWQEALEQGKSFFGEYPILTADGKEKWVLEQGTGVYDAEGNVLAMEGIIIDITQRKQVEHALLLSKQQLKKQNEEYAALNEELRATNKRINEMNADLLASKERAMESEKLKSAFLANMSHEIRTPMNGILGFSQLLLNPDIAEGERKEFVGIIQNSGNQLLSIINDLIDISKIEANIITLTPSTTKVNEMLNELLLLFMPQAKSSDISLSFSAGLSNAQSMIMVDGNRLRQILTNLLSNSLKFTQQGHVKFGYSLKKKHLEFFVEDSGIGIPTDKQSLIFERFRQVESSIERQVGGTGLGLAISKALVKKMGGVIWVESEPYFGSTFFFTLPYTKIEQIPVQTEKEQEPIDVSGNTELNVLIAEDNEVNYIFLKELLSDLNPHITWVTNGKEALDYVANNPDVDIVLMDIKMPVMDGYQATREIKKIRSDLPIIAQTAYAFEPDRQKAFDAGCDEYVAKPINKDRFLEILIKYIKVK